MDSPHNLIPNPQSAADQVDSGIDIRSALLGATGKPFYLKLTPQTPKYRDRFSGYLAIVGGNWTSAYRNYIQVKAKSQASVLSQIVDNGKTYYQNQDNGWFISQAASPRLWLYYSYSNYAVAWNFDGKLFRSTYDTGNPLAVCVSSKWAEMVSYLCTVAQSGQHGDSVYDILDVEMEPAA
jgi:hypothetical protein